MNKKKIYIINGPNLNMLGHRENHHYGDLTLDQIKQKTNELIKNHTNDEVELDWLQYNAEHQIIEKIQQIYHEENVLGLIINPAGFSHTSVAILDALLLLTIPVIEVHLSHITKRESFRQSLLTAQGSSSIIMGFKGQGYYLAALSLCVKF